MTTQIHILSDDMIGKIAAGEVIERPASIVKELVENSIDAQAREISIDICEGGRGEIIVADDGCGMSKEDARLCVLRHATSKIQKADDIYAISTLGFRGEALPSIAAVSRLTIETCESASIVGFRMEIRGGEIIEEGDVGCPRGTKIAVRDIFFNTPVRKKFLKTDKTEKGHIFDTISRLAISHPEVRFKFRSDGRDELLCLSCGDAHARILEVFGKDVAVYVNEFCEEADGIRVRGFLGDMVLAKNSAHGVYLFVNGRFVRDKLLNHAVMDGYRNLIPSGQYPFAVVHLEIDAGKVDVNVHPTKQEVRFEKSSAVHNFVAMAVKKNVGGTHSPLMGEGRDGGEPPHPDPLPQGERGMYEYSSHGGEGGLGERGIGKNSSLRIIGQLASTYVLCENNEGALVVIDQHAAHERIGFEKLKAQSEAGSVATQRLLIPEQVELAPREAGYLTENMELLNRVGLEIEPFGGRTFLIKSVPSLLADMDIKGLINKIAAEFSEIGASGAHEELMDHILKTFACHRQVRAGARLSEMEMSALLREMDVCANIERCPHGRPTVAEFSSDVVEKWFRRT